MEFLIAAIASDKRQLLRASPTIIVERSEDDLVHFAERLVRQLGEMSKAPSVADFFELVGRRFVYATLALTLLALLALAVPSTGPVQSLSAADIQVPAQEASLAYSDPIGETGLQESPNPAPAEAPTPAITNEAK